MEENFKTHTHNAIKARGSPWSERQDLIVFRTWVPEGAYGTLIMQMRCHLMEENHHLPL